MKHRLCQSLSESYRTWWETPCSCKLQGCIGQCSSRCTKLLIPGINPTFGVSDSADSPYEFQLWICPLASEDLVNRLIWSRFKDIFSAFSTSPLRTDVDENYRWSNKSQQWTRVLQTPLTITAPSSSKAASCDDWSEIKPHFSTSLDLLFAPSPTFKWRPWLLSHLNLKIWKDQFYFYWQSGLKKSETDLKGDKSTPGKSCIE